MMKFGNIFEVGSKRAPGWDDLDSFPPLQPKLTYHHVAFGGGMKIVQTKEAVRTEEDWSRVRSPGRARRRRAKHPQNIVVTNHPCAYALEGVLYCHPDFYKKMMAETKDMVDREVERQTMNAILGRPLTW